MLEDGRNKLSRGAIGLVAACVGGSANAKAYSPGVARCRPRGLFYTLE